MQRPPFTDLSIKEIGPGEHYATNSNTVIKTLLGSCVAVCLYDPKARVIGMNHFMLPSDISKRAEILDSKAGYYGIHAMELVITLMVKLGADQNRMQSKIFGGGNVVQQLFNPDKAFKTVGDQNIVFADKFLKNENITVISRDTGGSHGRVIYFDPSDFSVYRMLISHQQEIQVQTTERIYFEKYQKQITSPQLTYKVWN